MVDYCWLLVNDRDWQPTVVAPHGLRYYGTAVGLKWSPSPKLQTSPMRRQGKMIQYNSSRLQGLRNWIDVGIMRLPLAQGFLGAEKRFVERRNCSPVAIEQFHSYLPEANFARNTTEAKDPQLASLVVCGIGLQHVDPVTTCEWWEQRNNFPIAILSVDSGIRSNQQLWLWLIRRYMTNR